MVEEYNFVRDFWVFVTLVSFLVKFFYKKKNGLVYRDQFFCCLFSISKKKSKVSSTYKQLRSTVINVDD